MCVECKPGKRSNKYSTVEYSTVVVTADGNCGNEAMLHCTVWKEMCPQAWLESGEYQEPFAPEHAEPEPLPSWACSCAGYAADAGCTQPSVFRLGGVPPVATEQEEGRDPEGVLGKAGLKALKSRALPSWRTLPGGRPAGS